MYKVSIIVPVYCVENELDRCVQSLRKQTYQNIEIILVDDGSPDRCPQMCDEYSEMDFRIKVVHQKNGGLSSARNAGLRLATGDYIMYVDSDDYIDFDACERLLRATMGEKVDIVVGDAIMEKPNGIELMVHTATPAGKIYSSKVFLKKAIQAYQLYAPACFNLYRRQFLIEYDLYFQEGIYFEDMQMLPRMFLAADKISCAEGIFYHYVVRENSIMTSEKNFKKEEDSFRNLAEWKVQFDDIQDKKLQKVLYGMLLKCYLHECRVYGVEEWKIKGLGMRFALQYGLDIREKVKGMAFSIAPRLYTRS